VSKGRKAPLRVICTSYHCPGDCGNAHPGTWMDRNYADHVLKAFDDQQHAAKREQADRRSEVQRKARNEL
jgi:hypothetical protein